MHEHLLPASIPTGCEGKRMSERVILKIGGSVITDKSGEGLIRYNEIERISEIIASRNNLSLLLVHGAGSCGHPEASRYQISDGGAKENRTGIFETHKAVARLN